MSVFAPFKSRPVSKVSDTQYIRTENKPDEAAPKDEKPTTPDKSDKK